MSSVTEVKQAPGRWQLDLIEGTPREIIDQLTPFGHIAIAPGKIDVSQVGDNLLEQARYVGVYRGGKVAAEGFSLEGSGMAFWVGDEDGKGPLIESLAVSASTFAATVRALLPDAVEEGTLYSVGGSATLTHTFQWETVKSALNYTARAFSTPTAPVSWRIDGDATIDAGPDTQLFRTQPNAILVKKDAVLRTGRGFDVIGVSGDLQLEEAYNDYTTKVVVIGQGEGGAYIAASASLAASAIAYSDMHGNPVAFTRLVDEFEAENNVASAVAASLLSRFDSPAYGATLSSDDYDVRGDFVPGDHVAVFAPDIGFVDYTHEMYYEGVPINPMFIQVQGMTWPVPSGFTVGFRTMAGTWLDLSDFYRATGGQTLIDVGDNPSGLTSLGFDVDRSRFITDASVPATPVFGDFYTSHYLNAAGETRGQVLTTWSQPLNSDGSTIIDGHHYEIRYRPNVTAPYAATWGEAAQDTWDELFTWMQPRVPGFTTDEWHVLEVPFDQTQAMVNELFPSVVYEFQIRAVDGANPPNKSAWSASKAFTVARDTLPPAQPAAPSVAGSRLAVQVIHTLGRNDGGTFNLDLDTGHLEVHVSGDPLFFPDDSTLAGRLVVGAALASQTPVVGTFAVEETTERYVRVVAVDREGNRSNASNTATATAELIDDAHISDLTVSKLTAGTITSDWILGATIKTGVSGNRVELNATGLQAYDDDGDLTVNLSSDPEDTAHYIQFRGDMGEGDQILASVTDEGIVTAQAGYFNTLYLGGDSVDDRFAYEPPRGVVAFGSSLDDMQGRGANLMRGYIEIAFEAEEDRAYKISVFGDVESSSADPAERFAFEVYDGGSDIPTVDLPGLGTTHFSAAETATANITGQGIWIQRCPEDISAGTHRLLWGFKAVQGNATMRGADGPSFFYVEDIGPSDWYEDIAVRNDGGYNSLGEGGGVSSEPKNPSARKSYQRTYTCSWSGTYSYDPDATDGIIGTLIEELDDVRQGYDPTYGHVFGLFGFPEQMYEDLADATIVRMRFTAYARKWHRAAGGTAIIGHQWRGMTVGTRPTYIEEGELSTESGFADPDIRTGWPKIGSLMTLLTNTKEWFNSESAGAIALGDPSEEDEDTIYRGRFDGATQAHPAFLRIVYIK